jgi:hypothetical protein
MPQLGISFQEEAKASNNLLPKSAQFNDLHSWDSDANSVVNNSFFSIPYAGTRSCLITLTSTNESVIQYGEGSLSTIIKNSGQHFLRLNLLKEDDNADITFKVQVFVNSVALPTNLFTCNVFDSSGYVNQNWTTYFQTLNLVEDDVVDFIFYVQTDTIGAKLYFDGFKLERNDRVLENPSMYSETPDTILEVTELIDLPSIANNSTYVLQQTLVGAIEGDFVEVSIPSVVANTDLFFSQAYCQTPDIVKIKIHNFTGGAVDAPQGVFKFKIVK